jgi:hypothetical protein
LSNRLAEGVVSARLTSVFEPSGRLNSAGSILFGGGALTAASTSGGSPPVINPTRSPLASSARLASSGTTISSAAPQTASFTARSRSGRGRRTTVSLHRFGSITWPGVPSRPSGAVPSSRLSPV